MSAHRGRPPCVTNEVGCVCGSRLEAAVAWSSSGVRLVAGGGHLYSSRGSEVPESAVLRLRSAGALSSAGAVCRNPAGSWRRRCGTGRRRRACGAGKAGGRAVSVTAPIPAVRDQAFSCPWLSGGRGARTCSGRWWPETCLAARIRWSARL